MVRRAEHSIAAHPDRRQGDQTPAEVNGYLMELGRNPVLKEWRFRQASVGLDRPSYRASSVASSATPYRG